MEKIKGTSRNGGNLKATRRRLGFDRHQLFAVKDGNRNATTDTDEVVIAAEHLYFDLYSDIKEQEIES